MFPFAVDAVTATMPFSADSSSHLIMPDLFAWDTVRIVIAKCSICFIHRSSIVRHLDFRLQEAQHRSQLQAPREVETPPGIFTGRGSARRHGALGTPAQVCCPIPPLRWPSLLT
jgi:hypothetical protein